MVYGLWMLRLSWSRRPRFFCIIIICRTSTDMTKIIFSCQISRPWQCAIHSRTAGGYLFAKHSCRDPGVDVGERERKRGWLTCRNVAVSLDVTKCDDPSIRLVITAIDICQHAYIEILLFVLHLHKQS